MATKASKVRVNTISDKALYYFNLYLANVAALKALDDEYKTNKEALEVDKNKLDELFRMHKDTDEDGRKYQEITTKLILAKNAHDVARKPLIANMNSAIGFFDLDKVYAAYCADLDNGTKEMHKEILEVLYNFGIKIKGDRTKAVTKFMNRFEAHVYGSRDNKNAKDGDNRLVVAVSQRTWTAHYVKAWIQLLSEEDCFELVGGLIKRVEVTEEA